MRLDLRSAVVGFVVGCVVASTAAYAITTSEIWRSVYSAADSAIEVTIVP